MSYKIICDICKEEIEKDERMVRNGSLKHYCKKCWMNKKNWTKIHEE